MFVLKPLAVRPIALLSSGQLLAAIASELYRVALIWIAVDLAGSAGGYIVAARHHAPGRRQALEKHRPVRTQALCRVAASRRDQCRLAGAERPRCVADADLGVLDAELPPSAGKRARGAYIVDRS
jgi:hypothetical protein